MNLRGIKKTAPVVLFVYNRPLHTQHTVDALCRNALASSSQLFIFSDGPKNEQAVKGVQEVREYIRTIEGFASVEIVEQKENLGLARSIISGVTRVVEEHGKVIVLEDDLITSPYFLDYMNDGLELYENCDAVASVNAYMYPIDDIEGLPETFFLRSSDCWGWGTWKRAWRFFECNGAKLLQAIIDKNLVSAFNMNGYFPYLKMLQDQVKGQNDSWAIRWAASTLVNNQLGLYPGRSLVSNIGLDGTGRHCARSNASVDNVVMCGEKIEIALIEPVFDEDACAKVGKYLKENVLPPFWGRCWLTIKRNLKKLLIGAGLWKIMGRDDA